MRRCRPALEAVEPRLLLSGFTFAVTSLSDTGTGSGLSGDLRYCITSANLNPGSTIDIQVSGTDNLASALPDLLANTIITNSTPGTFTVNGGGSSSDYNALKIGSGVTATIDGVNFTNFHSSGSGGIFQVEGSLTLNNADLGLSSSPSGGAVYVGFGGYLTTNLTNFHDNSSGTGGGAIQSYNSVVLNGGFLINNSASSVGGAILNDGYLYAIGVEFAGNIAESDGGAIYADAGMGVETSNLLLTNCTIDSNAALNRGGGIISYFNATLTNVTIANNTSSSGSSGAGLYYGNGSATLNIFNSIIAQNSAGASESDIDGSGSISASSSYNLIGNTTLGGITDGSQGNQIGTSGTPLDPGLQSRAMNGGSSYTLGLTQGSPARGAGLAANAIDPVTSDPLPYDQRGVGFPRVVNNAIDIGAYQTQLASTSVLVSAASGTYGGTATITVALTSGANPVGGQQVDIMLGSTDLGIATTDNITGIATLQNVSLAAYHAGAFTGEITATFAGDSTYAASDGSGDLSVDPAALTITADDQSKVYGDALPTLTASYSGFVNGDTPLDLTTLPTLTTTATSSSHVSGSPYAITAGGAVSSDYAISYVPGSLTVTAASLTITADDQAKVYGDAVPTLTASYSGFVNGDTPLDLAILPTLTTTATAFSDVAGSPYAITVVGAVDADYAISYVPGNLIVSPAPLVVVGDTLTRVYGQANPALTGSIVGVLNGDDVGAQFGTSANAASDVIPDGYAINLEGLTGAKAGNYAVIGSTPGRLTITPTPLTITANDATKQYGQANPAFTASSSGFVLGQDMSDLSGALDFLTPATAASHVGSYAVEPTGLTSDNYAIRFVPGTLAMTPAPLTITANDASMTQGEAVPSLSASYAGFVNGDGPSSLSTSARLTTAATSLSAAGLYPIAVDSAASADYTIRFVPGTLTVTAATPIDQSRDAFVSSLYRDLLGRTPETSGLQFWTGELARGTSRISVALGIFRSPERAALQAAHQGTGIGFFRAYVHALRVARQSLSSGTIATNSLRSRHA